MVFLNGDLLRPLHEPVQLKLGLSWRPQDVGDARVMDLQRKAADKKRNQPKKKKYVAVNKDERNQDLKSTLISDIEMRCFEFPELVFHFVLVKFFLAMLSSLCFGMVLHMLCHYMLEVCNLLFYFSFTEDYS